LHTIVANSTFSSDCAGTINSAGYNLIENTAGCTISGDTTGNITGLDPKLGPLALNPPGTTETHALQPGSPAIDAGNPAGCTDASGNPVTTDQRGVPRPQGLSCDIGAYETGGSGAPPSCSLTQTVSYDGSTLTLSYTLSSTVDTTLHLWLLANGGATHVAAFPLQPLNPPLSSGPIPIAGFPNLGVVGWVATMETPGGTLCWDFDLVDTSASAIAAPSPGGPVPLPDVERGLPKARQDP
jgi:hypothetical protein